MDRFDVVVKRTESGEDFPKHSACGVILHHTAAQTSELSSNHDYIEQLIAIHTKEKKYSDIGYNFIVRKNGTICEGRCGSFDSAKKGEVIQGAHAGSHGDHNKTHYGVALEGKFHPDTPLEEDSKQRTALIDLLVWLAEEAHFDSASILEHRAVRAKPTKCPGFSDEVTRSIQSDVQNRLKQTQVSGEGAEYFEVKVDDGPVSYLSILKDWPVNKMILPGGMHFPVILKPEVLDKDKTWRSPLLGDRLLYIEFTRFGYHFGGLLAERIEFEKREESSWCLKTRLDNPVSIASGMGELQCAGELEVCIYKDKVQLKASEAIFASIAFNLGFRSVLGHLDTVLGDSEKVRSWITTLPFEHKSSPFAFEATRTIEAGKVLLEVRWPDLQSDHDWCFESGVWKPVNRLVGLWEGEGGAVSLPDLTLPGFGDVQGPDLKMEVGQIKIDEGKVQLIDAQLSFGDRWAFKANTIEVDDGFFSKATGGRVEWPFEVEAGAIINPPPDKNWLPALVIHEGTEFILSFSARGVELRAADMKRRVATVVLPALKNEEDFKKLSSNPDHRAAAQGHFYLAVEPYDQDLGFVIGADGLTMRARALLEAVELDEALGLKVTGGVLSMHQALWSLQVQAQSKLPWFQDATGSLILTAGSSQALSITANFEVAKGTVWRDPSGLLNFEDPRANVTVAYKEEDGWDVDGAVGGKFYFDVSSIGDAAADFAGDLLSNMQVEFEQLKISELVSLSGGVGTVRLKFLKPYSGSLWEVFSFKLSQIQLGEHISLSGDVGFDLGAVRFGGSLPDLSFSLKEKKIELEPSKDVTISGHLALPSGVRAALQLSHRNEPGFEAIEGKGTLRLPGVGDFNVLCSFGQWFNGEKKIPSVLVYVDTAYEQVLYPGIVVRRIGLGLGIHRQLVGSDDMREMTPRQLVKHMREKNTPSAGVLTSWVPSRSPVMFVMSSMLSATMGSSSEPDIYIASLTATLDRRLCLFAFMKGWVLTSLDDARTSAFDDHPYVEGALIINPDVPSLTAAMTTKRHARTSMEDDKVGPWVSSMLNAFQMQAGLEVSPRQLLWRFGPMTASLEAGPFRLSGQQLFALGVNSGRAWIAGLLDVGVDIEKAIFIEKGPATFEFGVRAGVGGQLSGFGVIQDDALSLFGEAQLRAYFHVYGKVAIRFEIKFKIKIGPFKVKARVKVSISSRTFRVGLEANVTLGLLLGTDAGVAWEATATLNMNLFGFRIDPKISINANSKKLNAARAARNKVLEAGGGV